MDEITKVWKRDRKNEGAEGTTKAISERTNEGVKENIGIKYKRWNKRLNKWMRETYLKINECTWGKEENVCVNGRIRYEWMRACMNIRICAWMNERMYVWMNPTSSVTSFLYFIILSFPLIPSFLHLAMHETIQSARMRLQICTQNRVKFSKYEREARAYRCRKQNCSCGRNEPPWHKGAWCQQRSQETISRPLSLRIMMYKQKVYPPPFDASCE